MKKFFFYTLSIITVLSAYSKNSIAQTTKRGKSNSNTRSYAEISIRQGGIWKDRVYEGGTFNNVQKLKLPAQHTDHSNYIRYEGPGWESEKIGYRLYLDWRNAIDIFGKVNDSIVLAGVGQDGFESYHNLSAWGQDILKVGKALGIGSIGRWVDKEVLHFNEVDSTLVSVHNSKKGSKVGVDYFGWKTGTEKIDLTSRLTIAPGKRYTKHTIKASSDIKGICTGIVNLNMDLIKNESENKKWAYIATYGAQSLVPDKLGMAIFYKTTDAEKIFDWEADHLIMFKPTIQPITFYFLGSLGERRKWNKNRKGIYFVP